MQLNQLKDSKSTNKSRKRVGRGIGSGKGKTSGAGHKGQKSRSGVSIKGFEGGQMPLHRRLPKRGFVNIYRKRFAELNVGRIQEAIDSKKINSSKTINEELLKEKGLITHLYDGVRLLGSGKISKSININVTSASSGAVKAIEKAGGKVKIGKEKENSENKKNIEKKDENKKSNDNSIS